MPNRCNLTGVTFGRLTVIEFQGINKYGGSTWLCQCACGNRTVTSSNNLNRGCTRSCGCLNDEKRKLSKPPPPPIKHGLCGKGVFKSWQCMLDRCYNPNSHAYSHYGGRGIRVCEGLRSTAVNLFLLIGDRPDGKSLDRIDNTQGYQCGICSECSRLGLKANVRWADRYQQMQNTRWNRFIEHEGQVRCLSEWSRILNIPARTITNRLSRGYPPFIRLRKKREVKNSNT